MPSEALRKYVVRFIEIRNGSASTFTSNIIPRAYPAFIFTAPEMNIVGNTMAGRAQDYLPGKIYFGGLGICTVQLFVRSNTHFIVALLQPYCAGMFLKEDAAQYSDTLHCLSDSKDFNIFNQQLWDEKNRFCQILMIEQFILTRAKKQSACPYIVHAIDIVGKTLGGITIKKLAAETFTSERNLRRRFMQQVGLSPKDYADIIRFNSFLKDVFTQPHHTIHELLMDHNYYDLSHLYKNSLRYTNATPAKLLLQNKLLNQSLLF